MPTLHIPPRLDLHYLVDDYTDPWRTPGTILLLHGNAESSAAWYAWVPQLAHRYRVVRPDMRGFGASTPMPRDFPWTLDILIDDFCRLMDVLGVERFHLVGAKIGGTIARAFAARRPARVRTLTVVGTPPPYRVGAEARAPALIAAFEQQGVEPWARQSMAGRLGSTFPPEGAAWWTTFMGRTAVSTQIGFMSFATSLTGAANWSAKPMRLLPRRTRRRKYATTPQAKPISTSVSHTMNTPIMRVSTPSHATSNLISCSICSTTPYTSVLPAVGSVRSLASAPS
jgi:pimeloyl-ACP methyl ester carboxylesterase